MEESSIDLIYLSTVFHGFQEDQIANFQKEIKRLLKPNARLAIVEIQKQDTPFGPPMDIRFSPEELIQTINMNHHFEQDFSVNKDITLPKQNSFHQEQENFDQLLQFTMHPNQKKNLPNPLLHLLKTKKS